MATIVSNKINLIKSRHGLGMNGSLRPTKGKNSKWGWGLFRRQNSPPGRSNFNETRDT